MKNFRLKRYLRSLLFFMLLMQSPWAIAYNPAAYVDATFVDEDETLIEERVNDETIEETEEYDANSEQNKAFTENRAGKVIEAEDYFQNISYSSCEAPSDYTCPPLIESKTREGYRTRIDFIDLKNGEISCSVFKPIGFGQALSRETETIQFKKKFINSTCVEKYSRSRNIDNSDQVKKLIEENEEFINSLQQQEFKYSVDYKMNGDDMFLDWADVVDGLVTFNAEIFDLEQTLLTRSLKTRNGYTVVPNEIVVDKFEQSLGNLWSRLTSGSWSDNNSFREGVEIQASVRNIANAMADTNYFMLLDFFIKSNDLIITIVTSLGFIFIGYNVVVGWIVPNLYNKIEKKDSVENNIHRGIFGIAMIFMFVATEVDVVNVEYEDYDGIARDKIEIKQTRMQNLGQMLFTGTNWFSDKIAKIGFEASSNALNASTGLLSADQISALASERIILNKEKVRLAEIDREMCAANYDLRVLTQKLRDYREKTLSRNDGAGDIDLSRGSVGDRFKMVGNMFGADYKPSSIEVNPYPKSEREARAIMGDTYKNHESPYNGGIVNSNSTGKFRSSGYSPLSLSGCYNNKKE